MVVLPTEPPIPHQPLGASSKPLPELHLNPPERFCFGLNSDGQMRPFTDPRFSLGGGRSVSSRLCSSIALPAFSGGRRGGKQPTGAVLPKAHHWQEGLPPCVTQTVSFSGASSWNDSGRIIRGCGHGDFTSKPPLDTARQD